MPPSRQPWSKIVKNGRPSEKVQTAATPSTKPTNKIRMHAKNACQEHGVVIIQIPSNVEITMPNALFVARPQPH